MKLCYLRVGFFCPMVFTLMFLVGPIFFVRYLALIIIIQIILQISFFSKPEMNARYASMPGYSLILCFDKKLELKKGVF